MTRSQWVSATLMVAALATGAMLWLSRAAADVLRVEIGLLQDESRALARARTEHERLVAAQAPDAELARLRADREALLRLRGEIEQMKTHAQRMAHAQAASREGSKSRVPPAAIFKIAVEPDGQLSVDGVAGGLASLKQQLSALPRGERVDIALRRQTGATAGAMKEAVDALKEAVQASGLALSVRFE